MINVLNIKLMHKIRTVFAVAIAYVFVISAIISPLNNVFGLVDTMRAGGPVICLTDVDGDHNPVKDQQHSHQSECCVVCGRLDLATPALGAVVDVIAIPTRLPSETMRFALFQSRAPPDIIVRETLGQDPPLSA
jgi:hypothetical protein